MMANSSKIFPFIDRAPNHECYDTVSNNSTTLISSTSSSSEDNYLSNNQNEESLDFIIDVQRKKKVFTSYEERKRYKQDYQRKIKTELCKTWQLRGSCKYGNNCSFAHGKAELKEKKHLHLNYKTKPCQQYFMKGFCFYGYRCQYLHSEVKFRPEYHQFLIDAYQNTNINVRKLQGFQPESAILQNMIQIYCESTNLQEFFNKFECLTKKRLPCFSEFSKKN